MGWIPTLALCGHGRCGKDSAAEWLRDNTLLTFKGGCSWTALPYVAGRLGISTEEAWATRHDNRMEWYHICNEYRKDDPSRLIRDVLKHSDLVCGIRDRKELVDAKEKGLIDLIIWIDRDVPCDPTVTYTIDDADIVIRNNGDLDSFYKKLGNLARAIGVGLPPR